MNQSELETNTCSRRQTRENAYRQVATNFGFIFDWLIKRREIFSQSQSVAMQNPSNCEITFDTQLKTALVPCRYTAKEVSFEWSHHRISSTDSKFRTTPHVFIIDFGSERVKKPYVIGITSIFKSKETRYSKLRW